MSTSPRHPTPESPGADQQAAGLVERDAELAAIARLVERAASGSAGVLLLEGPAGVGKTRLLEQAVALGADGPLSVLQARGGELEQPFPFGIATQLLERSVAALDAAARAAVLSGAAALAADVVDPRAPRGEAVEPSQEALHTRLHGLYWVCAGLAARRPLLMVVDDAHWADEPSLQWLLFMTRRLDDMPLTLVVGARPAPWPPPLALLADQARVSRIRVQPLSDPAGRVVIGRLLGVDAHEEFTRACQRATGGNPFLLGELVAAVRAEGLAPTAESATHVSALAPAGISRSLLARLSRMPPDAVALANAVAVLGAEAELRHAAALAGLDAEDTAAAADSLTAAGLLDAGRPLRLVHPVLRTALYSELPAGARAALHARAARTLAEEQGDLDAIAAHVQASEPAGKDATVELLLAAAARALARGAPTAAATYLRRALIEPPAPERRGTVLHLLGVVETRLGDPAAADHVGEAVRLAREPSDRANLAFEASSGYVVGGRLDKAVAILEDGIREVAESDAELRWRLEAQLIAVARLEGAHTDVAARHLAGIPHDLRGTTPGERLVLAELAWAALAEAQPVGRVAELALRAFGSGAILDRPGSPLSVLNGIWALTLSEQHEQAGQAYDALIGAVQRAGSPIMFALISSRRSQLHCLRGEIADAIADARASIDAGGEFLPGLVGGLYGRLIDALLEAGDVDGAEAALAAGGFGEAIPEAWQFFPLIQSRGRLRIAGGQLEAGVEDMLVAQRVLTQAGIENPAAGACRSAAAVALARLGRRAEAEELVTEELAAARRFGAPGTLGIALRAAGLVREGGDGMDLLREAVAQLERSPARLEHARALADLGGALRRSGRRRDAQPLLRQALDLADRCGGKVVAERARAELVITGARPRRERISGVRALTPSERRVAQLAAEGLTNRQIAQALFVSHPTVVTHLGHCYQKLDISSREQLAAALAEP